jgi:hypothetical protein
MIDVSYIEPAELLRLLYNAIDMGKRHGLPTFPEPMRIEEARRIITERTRDGVARFDYLNGRPIKVAIGPAQVDERFYDRENGPGAFAAAIGVEYVKKYEHVFFRLDGDRLVPCEDYGEVYRGQARNELGQRLRGVSARLTFWKGLSFDARRAMVEDDIVPQSVMPNERQRGLFDALV